MSESVEYEQFVARTMQALNDARLDGVKVLHNQQVEGISTTHQVDVLWEFSVAGVRHRVIVNAKHYKRSVEKTDVLTLAGVLRDVPGASGMIVTTTGFQSGAIEFARTHSIALMIVRPPNNDDYEGFIRTIVMTMRLDVPELTGSKFTADLTWAAQNLTPEQRTLLSQPRQSIANDVVVEDLDTGTRSNFNDLWRAAQQIVKVDVSDGPVDCEHRFTWSNAMYHYPGYPSFKIATLELRWRITPGVPETMEISAPGDIAIIQSALDGYTLFVGEDGVIRGDRELAGLKPH